MSDMAGMLSSVPTEELIMDPTPTKADNVSPNKADQLKGSNHSNSTPAANSAPPATGLPQRGETEPASYEAKQHYHLKPTTPGVFRRTIDPFSEMTGRIYGLKNMGQSEMHIGGYNSMPPSTVAELQANPTPGRPTPATYHESLEGANRKESMVSSASDGELKTLQKSESQSSPESQAGGKKQSEGAEVWPPPPPLS